LLASSLGGTDSTHQRLYVYLAATLAVAVIAALTLVKRASASPAPGYGLPEFVVIVTALAFSFFANGVFGVLPHQLAFGLCGLATILITTRHADIRISLPMWLVAYGALGVGLQLAVFGLKPSVFLDIGLSVLALGVLWQLACVFCVEGGVMRFLGLVATAYWTVTIVAVLVEYSHVKLGGMSPNTVQLPWQGVATNIFVSGNVLGYGAIFGQAGREMGAIVAIYHFVRWRDDRRQVHLLLALVAFAFFLTAYGRVPFVGAAIAFAVTLSTSERGTKRSAVVAIIVVTIAVASAPGVVKSFASERVGQQSFSTGHVSLWSQHLGLFILNPITGVGSRPTVSQQYEASLNPVFTDTEPLPAKELVRRGSRGEGGWTGVLAQRGVVSGGMILALLATALAGTFRPFPRSSKARQDMTVLRALLPATAVWYVTDIVPMSVYTFTAFVVAQVTMIGVAQSVRRTVRPHGTSDLA
jgi:hypothetical protein